MKKHSVIIIGGGLGGLFTAALLAKEGMRVDVLEKNAVCGGGLQTFRRWGQLYETGMHIIGGLQRNGALHKICTYLDILRHLKLRDADKGCMDEIHFLADGKTYEIAQGRQGFVDSLAKHFPEQRQALTEYVDHLYAIADKVDMFHLRNGSDYTLPQCDDFLLAANELIALHIKDTRLQRIVAYMNPLYGGVYGHTPAYIHALISVLYINGTTRFVDGSQQLADALMRIVEDNGGRIINNTKVCKMNVEDKRILSVEDTNGRQYAADTYISAIHPCTMLDCIADGVLTKAYRNRLHSIPNTYSAFNVFLLLKPQSFRYINHTGYCQDEYESMWNYADNDHRWPHGMMYMTPPTANQGEYSEKMIITTPMLFDEVRQWEHTTVGKRGDDYVKWKQAKAQLLIDKLATIYPNLKDAIIDYEAASPLTIRDYYGSKEGAMYGFRKDCHDIILSQIPPVTKIKNLILTGQNINLHGICGVPITAVATAELLLGKNSLTEKINTKYSELWKE